MTAEERLERYARLAVEIGSNVGEGQVVWVIALPEHAPLARAVARVAYEKGARYVDVDYADQHVRRARIELAAEDSLGWTPPWTLAKVDHVAEEHGALIQIVGDPEPELLADLDGTRVGKTRMRELAERYVKATNQRLINWTILAYPNEGWATSVFGEPDVERLWDAVADATRLDEPDPVEAWRTHIDKLVARAELLNERAFDCLRFRGPGTDLTVGLIPGATWCTALEETVDGRRHVVNMPTEEVFTSPDRRRTEGVVRSTLPLALSGNIVRDLEIRFEGGRAVEVDASSGRGADPRAAAPGRERVHARRGRARRRRLSRRPFGPRLPEHALRRERELPHRLRRGHPRRDRRRRRQERGRARGARLQHRRSTPTS